MSTTDLYQVVTNPQPLTAEEATRVEQYWTPDRLATARPLPLPSVYLPRRLRKKPSATTVSKQARGPVISEPVPPDTVTGTPTAATFNTRLVEDMSVYPYAVVGKLFMTIGGGDYVGTGWVIGERTVFTAGHCVHELVSGWATNVLFEAQYNNGDDVGEWALPSLGSLRGWTQEEDFEFDMGMGISTRPIRPVTGKAGWLANIEQIPDIIKSIGYPAENIVPGYNFDGQQMWECNGKYINTEDGIMAMHNNMTGGCSGGPGFVTRSDQLYAIWVNSFRYRIEPNILRSPYFGTGFLNLIEWMRDNNGDS